MHQESWTVLSMLDWATNYFNQKGIKNSRLSIEWLLAHVLEVKRLDLYLLFERPLSSGELEQLRPLVQRRAKHEPLQYIIGETDFFGLKLSVSNSVLIPRPETEELVERILRDHPKDAPLKVMDIGTGSGCIALALKHHRPDWEIWAMDTSEEALRQAQANAKSLDLSVQWFQDDLFDTQFLRHHPELAYQFDVVVSNPPYILNEERSNLDAEVVNYEPELALFCRSTGHMYESLMSTSKQLLKNQGGHFYFELHERYGEEVRTLYSSVGIEAKIVKDLGEKDRFIVGTL